MENVILVWYRYHRIALIYAQNNSIQFVRYLFQNLIHFMSMPVCVNCRRIIVGIEIIVSFKSWNLIKLKKNHTENGSNRLWFAQEKFGFVFMIISSWIICDKLYILHNFWGHSPECPQSWKKVFLKYLGYCSLYRKVLRRAWRAPNFL